MASNVSTSICLSERHTKWEVSITLHSIAYEELVLTSSASGILPFFLHANIDKPWICPILLFGQWWDLTQGARIIPQGYVFWKWVSQDGWSCSPEHSLVSYLLIALVRKGLTIYHWQSVDSFMKCFWNNLLNVGIDPHLYGTYLFHHSSCQYLTIGLHWNFCKICDWAGYADNFDNPGTLFKYLLL